MTKSLGLFIAGCWLTACGSAGPSSPRPGGPAPVRADSQPPRLMVDPAFTPGYPAVLQQVGIQGRIMLKLRVDSTGLVDRNAIEVDRVTNSAFVPSMLTSITGLHVRPARAGGRAIAGAMNVALLYRLETCDTTGARPRVRWMADSTPPMIEVWSCTMPVLAGWVPHHLLQLPHVVLRGRWPSGPDSVSFFPCRGEKLPMLWPPSVRHLIPVDVRQVADWRPMSGPTAAPRGPGDHYVQWEGELIGPDAMGDLGIAAFIFKPTRILSAAPWGKKSCPLE